MVANSANFKATQEQFLGELADAAFQVVARHGIRGPSIDHELALWRALGKVVRKPARCLAGEDEPGRVQREDFLAKLTDAAYQVALANGFRGPFLDLEMDLWKALRRAVQTDAFAAQELELAKGDSGEARPADDNPGSFTPYHGPWFAGVAWGALLCAAYPLLILMPLAVFTLALPYSNRVPIVYANRGADDIVFRKELQQIESGGFPARSTIHILSRPPDDWVGRTGRLDTASLGSLCGGFSGKRSLFAVRRLWRLG